MYTFFRFDQRKVCLCTYKLNASGQEIGKMSDLASLTLTFKQVLAGLLNPSFNKCYMRLLGKKQKIIYIYLLLPLATRKKIRDMAIKDHAGYRPEAIRNKADSGRLQVSLTERRPKHFTPNPIAAIQMTLKLTIYVQ